MLQTFLIMNKEKENAKTVKSEERQLLDEMLLYKTQESDYVDEQIILAMDDLRKHSGTIETRSYLMEVFLQHASKKKNATGDKERLMMLQVFQIFNVA